MGKNKRLILTYCWETPIPHQDNIETMNDIEHFGIPNIQNMTCTRELKERIINRYLSSIGWKPSNHTKCIGILDRIDEHINIAYTQLMDVMRYNTQLFFKGEHMETIDKMNAIFAWKGYLE